MCSPDRLLLMLEPVDVGLRRFIFGAIHLQRSLGHFVGVLHIHFFRLRNFVVRNAELLSSLRRWTLSVALLVSLSARPHILVKPCRNNSKLLRSKIHAIDFDSITRRCCCLGLCVLRSKMNVLLRCLISLLRLFLLRLLHLRLSLLRLSVLSLPLLRLVALFLFSMRAFSSLFHASNTSCGGLRPTLIKSQTSLNTLRLSSMEEWIDSLAYS